MLNANGLIISIEVGELSTLSIPLTKEYQMMGGILDAFGWQVCFKQWVAWLAGLMRSDALWMASLMRSGSMVGGRFVWVAW